MSDVFGPAYAAAYDLFYAEKDYEAECDMIERAFAEFSAEPVHRVLDLGCGTGGHAIPLARHGYDVVGVDRSPGMLAAARAKAVAAGVTGRLALVSGDLSAPLDIAPCDAALMMFAVLGYQTTRTAAAAALEGARRGLRPGGLLLFDVWYAAAIEREPPTQRWRVLERDGERLIRLSSGQLDRGSETCTITIRVLRLAGDRIADEAVEEHRVRYFSRDALVELLGGAGMELLRLGSFPEYWREPDARSWSVLGVARVVS